LGLALFIGMVQLSEENDMSRELAKHSERIPTTSLAAGLEKSLAAYAGAATAAGVSLLALAAPGHAKIVYTPANVTIPVNGGWVPIDLNHDGVADFSFFNSKSRSADSQPVTLEGRAKAPTNRIWGRGVATSRPRGVFASALPGGLKVGPNKSHFWKTANGYWLMAFGGGSAYSSRTYGQWLGTQHRYLGLRFTSNGQVHYGWARFNVTTQNAGLEAVVTGYAYETIPNKPIIAGKTKGPDVITLEPATLGRLAQGASGISAWRQKK
jgi:hypothetical protein